MDTRPCLLFLIHSLATGGAERQLCELVRHLDHTRFEIHVLVFYDPGEGKGGELWSQVASLTDVGLHSLHKRRGALGYLTAIPRAMSLLRRLQPDILHGYADANLLALLLGAMFRRQVVWGIRRTSQDTSKMDALSMRLLKLTSLLSRFVDLIIFNSEAGRCNHQRMGMRSPRMHVVTNGFDTTRFAPDPIGGAVQRRDWKIPEEAPLIGIVGRLNRVKDHSTFLQAAARLVQDWPTARFVCVGGGPPAYRKELQARTGSLGLADRVVWAGPCDRMPAAYNALTILVLSSTDEGFPNVVGEAMACGVPCVATRVGDAAALIGDTGFVVGIGDAAAIADAVSKLLRESAESRTARARSARQRICALFSAEALAHNTEQALIALMPGLAGTSPPGLVK